MRSWPRWRSKQAAQLLIVILLLSHLPFITADPDSNISFSRGPFTDEGLNTVQVRNLINHGYLDLGECDNLLKTPLFGLTVGAGMFIFGTEFPVSRLTVLILIMLTLYFLSTKNNFQKFILILVPVLFLKYQVHQFSHFSLAEMLSVASIFTGIYFLHQTYKPFRQEKEYIQSALLAGTFLSLAWYFKIQFIYILALGPLVAMERSLIARNMNRRILWLNGLIITASTLLLLFIYLLAWYLPHKDTYDYMMSHQSGTFDIGPKTWEYIRFNFTHFLFSGKNTFYSITFLACLLTGSILLFKRTSSHFPVLFKSSLIWLILEMHKLTMVYLPTRYQVSLFAAMGLLITVVLMELYHSAWLADANRWKSLARAGVIIWISAILVFNLADYYNSFIKRTYKIKQANEYLAATLQEDDLVLGAWAPAMTWESKSVAKPVWGGFLNDVDPIDTFQPRAVISEPDEQDSEQAYRKQGINLTAVSDSLITFQIGSWEVSVFWTGSAAAGTLSGL
jgi:hypothetical protein